MTLYRLFTSMKTTMALLLVVSGLLLLSLVLPQEAYTDPPSYEELLRNSRLAWLFLARLGLGDVAGSTLFKASVGLFFVNLLGVLYDRTGATLRKTRLVAPEEAALLRRTQGRDVSEHPLPPGWSVQKATEVLRGHGYQALPVGPRGLWAVRNRRAALGFLLFHASFFLIAAGGLAIYYTRFVGVVSLTEGQTFQGDYTSIARDPPLGRPDALVFTLEEVDARIEGGFDVHLGARLAFQTPAGPQIQEARVNAPAQVGHAVVLVHSAGLAPILWLMDAGGYTQDKVAVTATTRGGDPTEVRLTDALTVTVHPLEAGQLLPRREELATFPMHLVATRGDKVVFDGRLAPGQWAEVGEGERLSLADLRYWAGLRVVRERGAAVLILAFALGVIGLIWRQLWYRREVAITWNEERFTVHGRTDYFPWTFKVELDAIVRHLQEADGRKTA